MTVSSLQEVTSIFFTKDNKYLKDNTQQYDHTINSLGYSQFFAGSHK